MSGTSWARLVGLVKWPWGSWIVEFVSHNRCIARAIQCSRHMCGVDFLGVARGEVVHCFLRLVCTLTRVVDLFFDGGVYRGGSGLCLPVCVVDHFFQSASF